MIVDEDTTITKVNSEFEEFMGYAKDEVENKMKWINIVATEEYLNKMLKYHTFRRIEPESAPRNYETKLINKKGEVKDVFMTVAMIPQTKRSVASLLDITDKKKSRIALRESKARLKIAMDLAKLVSWEYDVKSDMFTFDDQFYALYGTSIEKEGGTKMSSEEYARRFIPPEDSSLVAEEIAGALRTEDPDYYRNFEHRIIRADGELRFMIVLFGIVKDDKGHTIIIYGANQDITERKKSEERIKASLKEKEALLKEVHHRVKNNMQIISSLLNLQSSHIDDEDAIVAFNESQGRIISMSLVHESLYLSNNLSRIDFENYVKKLVMNILTTYRAYNVDVKFKIDKTAFNIETAIPCGLIINELVTNSIKHAFEGNGGLITIEFTQESNKFKLVINDNGVGLPYHLFNGSSNSLGLELVKMLVGQLDGELKMDNINGTTFTIVFEELIYKERL
jgi:PAS domain S-box-containing protein